jgi:hypothetical protein
MSAANPTKLKGKSDLTSLPFFSLAPALTDKTIASHTRQKRSTRQQLPRVVGHAQFLLQGNAEGTQYHLHDNDTCDKTKTRAAMRTLEFIQYYLDHP